MKILILLAVNLLFMNSASATDSVICDAKVDGKSACVSGETMKCVKVFSVAEQRAKYEWHGVNADGQAFKTDIQLYKKLPGLTPMPCSSAASSHPDTQRLASAEARSPTLATSRP